MTLNESDITDPLKAAAGKVVTKTLSKIIKTIRNSNLSKYSKVRPVKRGSTSFNPVLGKNTGSGHISREVKPDVKPGEIYGPGRSTLKLRSDTGRPRPSDKALNPETGEYVPKKPTKYELVPGAKFGDKVMARLKKIIKINEVAPPGREDQVKALKKKFPNDDEAPYKIAWAQHNRKKDVKEAVATAVATSPLWLPKVLVGIGAAGTLAQTVFKSDWYQRAKERAALRKAEREASTNKSTARDKKNKEAYNQRLKDEGLIGKGSKKGGKWDSLPKGHQVDMRKNKYKPKFNPKQNMTDKQIERMRKAGLL